VPSSVTCERCGAPTTDIESHSDRMHVNRIAVDIRPGESLTVTRSGGLFHCPWCARTARLGRRTRLASAQAMMVSRFAWFASTTVLTTRPGPPPILRHAPPALDGAHAGSGLGTNPSRARLESERGDRSSETAIAIPSPAFRSKGGRVLGRGDHHTGHRERARRDGRDPLFAHHCVPRSAAGRGRRCQPTG
jgi:hypothetical protein